jgi:hypothetical protein
MLFRPDRRPRAAELAIIGSVDFISAGRFARYPWGAAKPPAGPQWLHEIKHNGYRLIARKGGRSACHAARLRLDRALPAHCRGRGGDPGQLRDD